MVAIVGNGECWLVSDVETVSRVLDLSVHCAGGVGDHIHLSNYAKASPYSHSKDDSRLKFSWRGALGLRHSALNTRLEPKLSERESTISRVSME